MRAPVLVALLVLSGLAGCANPGEDARAGLVPYPKLGDVATYELSGSYVEIARWQNAHALTGAPKLRIEIGAGPQVLDGARAIHPSFRVATALDGAPQSERFVDPAFEAVVQAVYPLSPEQSIVAFDERGFPWLFGASALFGDDIRVGGPDVAIPLPDNLGLGREAALAWHPAARESVDGVDALRLDLVGNASISGSVWMEPGVAWPLRARLELRDAGLAPVVRSDGALPASMIAKRVALQPGATPVAPRNRGAALTRDAAVKRIAWSGFAPPDGGTSYEPYLLGDALRDAQLLDVGLQQWLKGADDPRLYRATFKTTDAALPGARNQTWLVQLVDKGEHYYAVQMGRLDPPSGTPLPPAGAPRVESSGPADAPASGNHGWFAADALPKTLVPLGDAVGIVKSVFGANGVQIFLRSFAQPPGYSYFLDGGWDGAHGEAGRYTVVYNPETGFIEEATGPVTLRSAP